MFCLPCRTLKHESQGAPVAVLRAAFYPIPTDEGVQPQRASSLFSETAGTVFERVWEGEASQMR
ncbi:hypothetical protein SAMN04487948_10160 [Halogranum amylolyticum]|uniref:Uncharacterized protein n=1 Tax=Halogranum amylolyticum TaxID=660520 RepID=A0A1H8MS73_9EURY|nr:hypothetical protein SAMN04487948_10160 [Halogranum amylolyticum]